MRSSLAMSWWASMTSGVPLVGSSPMLSRPMVGSGMPMTSRANAWPMMANWRRNSGRTSALAPTSRKATGAGMAGMMVQIAGRFTPGMRRT